MFDSFKPTLVYLKIFSNKVEISDLRTGKSISRESVTPFSNKRLAIAEFNVAEMFIRSLIKELLPSGVKSKSIRVVIQQMENLDDGLSQSEKRILRDIGECIGGVRVVLVEHTRSLSLPEALSELEGK